MRGLLWTALCVVGLGVVQDGAFAQGERSFSLSFELTGEVSAEGTFGLADLQALPTQELEVTFTSRGEPQTHRYTGVLLYDLLEGAAPALDEDVNNDALRFYVRVAATDGYVATVSWGEIDPDFGNQPVLVAYEEDGEPLAEDGMARLVVPGDERGGRYVSNMSSITLLRATAP